MRCAGLRAGLRTESGQTRVVAVTLALLAAGHDVFIVTNAPRWIFEPCIAAGASYRQAAIDAGIVQPKAYDVDRQATLAILRAFLDARPKLLAQEVDHLRADRIDAVLVDAPFLPWCVDGAGRCADPAVPLRLQLVCRLFVIAISSQAHRAGNRVQLHL